MEQQETDLVGRATNPMRKSSGSNNGQNSGGRWIINNTVARQGPVNTGGLFTSVPVHINQHLSPYDAANGRREG
jgi:hypothetical protein